LHSSMEVFTFSIACWLSNYDNCTTIFPLVTFCLHL
jgi:hypothetical protein